MRDDAAGTAPRRSRSKERNEGTFATAIARRAFGDRFCERSGRSGESFGGIFLGTAGAFPGNGRRGFSGARVELACAIAERSAGGGGNSLASDSVARWGASSGWGAGE